MLEQTLDHLQNGESGEVTQVLVQGKIKRRLLTQLVEGATLGDTTSLQNPWAVEQVGRLVAAGLPR